MAKKMKVLVIGATGNIGGAVADALLAKNQRVRTITRNPGSERAKRLSDAGVEVLQGDLDDLQSLDEAMVGMDAIFAVTTPFEVGPEGEVKHGFALIDAARKAGVGHFIYSSVGGADRATGIPHFESKFKVEQQLAASGLNYTISAPVFVIDNYLGPWYLSDLRKGALKLAMPADRRLQVVSFKEIGAFGATLAERGETVFGKRYDIASDEISGNEIAAMFSGVGAITVRYEALDPEHLRAENADLADMFVWFDEVGYQADIPKLRAEFPEVGWRSAAEWFIDQDWSILASD